MKMQHSNMYLRATTDGERVVQSWADDWEWNQVWRVLPSASKADSSDSVQMALSHDVSNVYGSSLHYVDGRLFVEISSAFKDGANVRIIDLQGRELVRKNADKSVVFEVQDFAPGVYHVVIRGKNRTDVVRFKK
jgi:hypothetical protein